MALSKIKMKRMQNGLRQFDVSKGVGISEPYLSKIETGRVVPSEDLLRKIATILGVDCEELREDTDASFAKHIA